MAGLLTDRRTELDAREAARDGVTIGRRVPLATPRYRRGDWVEVRSESEIRATLDAEGKLQGLPFMPEMARYCGRRFRIYRRAGKAFLDHHYYVARLKRTVLLEGVRCDGASHDGCQMACLLFWKEAWLKPADAPDADEHTDRDHRRPSGCRDLPTTHGDRYCCQATELIRATDRLPWWDVRQYFNDLFLGEMTLGQFLRMVSTLVVNKLRRMRGRVPAGAVKGRRQSASNGGLHLQPGDRVEVRSPEEIEATLDGNGRNRGLAVSPQMLTFCGRRFRVADRTERIIVEWSGRMRRITDTVTLEGVTCDGLAQRGCPRDCYHLWRESWLKRVN